MTNKDDLNTIYEWAFLHLEEHNPELLKLLDILKRRIEKDLDKYNKVKEWLKNE